ncbi:MAG TPA: T9SS type A sorting domain-containing protein, partial [Bacteroidales bacterium]|nr:T9SS type A sorting domain-containing protein [Bacteroidales bacterium]
NGNPDGVGLRVLNNLGQTIIQRDLSESFKAVDVSGLPAGMYFLILKSETGTQTVKFIKD